MNANQQTGPLRGRRWFQFALMLCLATSLPTLSRAQEKVEPVTVNLGVSTAKPSELIDIPVTISGPKDAKIGNVSFRVTYPKAPLAFDKGEIGLAGEESKAKIDVSSKEDGDQMTLDATISATTPMKYGILAYLKFRAAKDVKKGEITVKLSNVKVSSPDNTTIAVGPGKDGEISVFEADEEIPVVGCFFFSH